jgi:cytolysin-activating lysine-acyltransferase
MEINMVSLIEEKVVHKSKKTVAQMLGEIVWLMTQSPTHKHFALADLEWMVMPPLLLEQYRIYYDGSKPIAVAFWAHLSEETETKLTAGATRLAPQEWRAGGMGALERDFQQGAEDDSVNPIPKSLDKPQGNLWLMDLICPFTTPKNSLNEKILNDLMSSVFQGNRCKYQITDPKTGLRKIKEL